MYDFDDYADADDYDCGGDDSENGYFKWLYWWRRLLKKICSVKLAQ